MGSYLLQRRSKLRYKQRLMLSLFSYKTWSKARGPLSPYLFVTAVEILAIAIRNQDNIKGITIAGLETKLLQFADDTTADLSDLDSARALFGLLELFEKASGLKLNVTKKEAVWIGSLQNCENENYTRAAKRPEVIIQII